MLRECRLNSLNLLMVPTNNGSDKISGKKEDQ